MREPIRIGMVWLEHGTGSINPTYQTAFSAGMDLQAAVPADEPLVLHENAGAGECVKPVRFCRGSTAGL